MTSRVHISCFHRIVRDEEAEQEWPYLARGTALTLSQFKKKLEALATDFEFIDEQTAANILVRNQSGPAKGCWITFDDGYSDTLSIAAPILAEYGIQPTLFLTTRLLDGNWYLPVDRWYSTLLSATRKRGVLGQGNEAWEFDLDNETDLKKFVKGKEKQRFIKNSVEEQEHTLELLSKALSGNHHLISKVEYLCRDDICTLTDLGWFVGSHGHTHLILPKCSDEEILREVLSSVSVLDELPIRRSCWFSYSDGVMDSRVQAILKRYGHVGALTTQSRQANSTCDPWKMPRFIEGLL